MTQFGVLLLVYLNGLDVCGNSTPTLAGLTSSRFINLALEI